MNGSDEIVVPEGYFMTSKYLFLNVLKFTLLNMG
jgi:hypothetical protein